MDREFDDRVRQRYSKSEGLREDMSSRSLAYMIPQDLPLTQSRAKGRVSSIDAQVYTRDCAYKQHPQYCGELQKQAASQSAAGELGGYGPTAVPESYKRPKDLLVRPLEEQTMGRLELLEEIDQSGDAAPNIMPMCESKLQCMRETHGIPFTPINTRALRYVEVNKAFE